MLKLNGNNQLCDLEHVTTLSHRRVMLMKKMDLGLVYHVRHSELVLLLIKLYSSSIVLFSCSESHLHADHVLVIQVKLLSSGIKATWLYNLCNPALQNRT